MGEKKRDEVRGSQPGKWTRDVALGGNVQTELDWFRGLGCLRGGSVQRDQVQSPNRRDWAFKIGQVPNGRVKSACALAVDCVH